MTLNSNKILNKAKKLKELADRGIAGEKDTAKLMLDKYIAKHNLTLKDIEDHTISDSRYASMSDEEFLNQIKLELIVLGIGYLFGFLTNDSKKYHADYKKEFGPKAQEIRDAFIQRHEFKTKPK